MSSSSAASKMVLPVGTLSTYSLVIGLLSILDGAAFPRDTVWSRFGSGYGYIPVILPVIGLMYLWQNRRPTDASGA